MGKEGAGHHSELPYYCNIKVHSLMCLELKNFIDRISQIKQDIEFARPRCSTGLQALCSLHAAMDKARLLIQHCSDCSKLYLAFTADRILSRGENIRKTLGLCLSQIQNMVPALLAAKISGIIEDLKAARFKIESSEAEAGKVVKELLKLDMPASDSFNESELGALQFAAVRLTITTPLAVLIEIRSIKKLHGKVHETDPKKKILEYLLYLLRKYRGHLGLLGQKNTEDGHPLHEEFKSQSENSTTPEPPSEFKCPMSKRIMYDPVIIASGQTFERVWIEKWFQEGNNTCPMTHVRLENVYFAPNVLIRGLISKWCSNHGLSISEPYAQSMPASVYLQKIISFDSVASIGYSMQDLHLQVGNISLRSSATLDDSNNAAFRAGFPQMDAGDCITPSKFDSIPWESKCKAIQQIKEHPNKNENSYDDSLVKPLIKFLMDAFVLNDVIAQNDTAEVLLSFISKSRTELPYFDKDAIFMLASFLDFEISGKALAIMEELSRQPFYKSRIVESGVIPAVIKILDSHISEFRELAMKIICSLSYNSDTAHHIVYLDCIAKFVPFLSDQSLSGYCLAIMKSLCGIEEGRIAISEANSCISSIATLVQTGNKQDQETAVEVLHSLCYDQAEHYRQIIEENAGLTLIYISSCENSGGKVITNVSDCSSVVSFGLGTDISSNSCKLPKGKKSASKGFTYFAIKLSKLFQ
ncbi:U-box domain-containing protein 5-like [Mercurialis annua]|uniref:U-box domain-containing protein 5-like n=1 Tax=Mercurialis annua TaxID=3986 RepID=UPI0021601145|nr:U-box domain-containing protein 5-like [Mercurialis annua]XP_050235906.1 U-box domain-containing protein 5-like [Mercurialis annua]XP_050235912.1 U-box domain-containing protein 5-like [Mercurialis annua]XP_050235918.1 U-box domain-containing protein 5-like [Mercurialis annua]XP_050235923.1 U-box domain-containing protein 5-like [Mercurialis annua]XP_055960220.1 U-box domain-containing protein 5-like [Mercurialis annua]